MPATHQRKSKPLGGIEPQYLLIAKDTLPFAANSVPVFLRPAHSPLQTVEHPLQSAFGKVSLLTSDSVQGVSLGR